MFVIIMDFVVTRIVKTVSVVRAFSMEERLQKMTEG